MIKLIHYLIRFVTGNPMLILQILSDIVLVILIILLIRERRRRKQRQELIVREQKSRMLIERISNPEYLKREGIEFGRSYPYKVRDGGAPLPEDAEKKDYMIDLSVQSQMLTRDFLLPVSEGIMIGRAKNNTICVDNPDFAEHQCRIFLEGNAICVESLSPKTTVILRGNNFHKVGESSVALRSSDILLIGENRVIVRF